MGHFDNPEAHTKMVRQDTGESNAEELADLLGTDMPVNTERCESTDADLQHAVSEGWPPLSVKRHQHKHSLKRRYEVLETLGKGTYGKVKKGVERRSGETVAIKSIRKERISDDFDRAHIQREIEIVSLLNHPNIIRMHEVFECREKIVMVMEYASGGELYDYIQQRQRLTEIEARSFFRQITSAVHYCHKNGVVHRDLKLENILLDQNLNVKLADFGLSNHYERGRMLDTFCGSPLYASPEIINGLPYQGPEVDCWALGVLLYTLVHGSMPFDGASYSGLRDQIRQGRYRKPQPPSEACGLIDWMLTVRMEDRATVEDVANHWWVNWGFEVSVCDCPPALHVQNTKGKYSASSCVSGYPTSKRLLSDAHLRLTFPPKRPASLHPCSALPRKSRPDTPLSPRTPATASPAHGQAAKMPKKGILKKLYERAAHSIPSERQPGSVDVSAPPSVRGAHRSEGQGRAEESRRRKGILKRNGKFTSASKAATPAPFPEREPDPELKNSRLRDIEHTQEEELER